MQFGDSFGLSLYDKDKAWLKTEDSKPATTSSNKPIERSESEQFIKQCEASYDVRSRWSLYPSI